MRGSTDSHLERRLKQALDFMRVSVIDHTRHELSSMARNLRAVVKVSHDGFNIGVSLFTEALASIEIRKMEESFAARR